MSKQVEQEKDVFLSSTQAAKLLNMSPSTFKKYIYSGKIKTVKTPGGHHRILKSYLLAKLNEEE